MGREETYVCILEDCIVNHVVIWRYLLLSCEFEILHAWFHLSKIDVAEASVEKHFT